jgi:hypothetical protein
MCSVTTGVVHEALKELERQLAVEGADHACW